MSSSPSSSPSPSSSLHLPHSSLFLSPDPATATSSSTDPAAATSSPTDLVAAPSSSVDLAVERPDPAVDLHHSHDAGIHHGYDAGTSTTAGEDASVRRDPRGGIGIHEEASAWSPASDWRGGGGRGKPGSVAGGLASGLENGLAGGLPLLHKRICAALHFCTPWRAPIFARCCKSHDLPRRAFFIYCSGHFCPPR